VNEIEPIRYNNCFTQCNRVGKIGLGQLIHANKGSDQNDPEQARALSPLGKKHEEKSRKLLIKSASSADTITGIDFSKPLKLMRRSMPWLDQGNPLRPFWTN
jgi:hypothetical protein